MSWFLMKFLSIPRWLWAILVAAVVLIGGILWAQHAENKDDARNQEIGASIERERALEETVKQVEKANEVREEITRKDDAGARLRYEQCLRSARTPANCERLLPERPAD